MMTQEIVRLPARCEDCGKAYRVPRADRTWPCKACGGTVRAEEAAPELDLPGTVTCAECHAINRDGASACVECGAELEHALPPPTAEHLFQLEERAAKALGRAESLIDGVSWVYRIGALAYLAVTVLAIFALAREDVPRGQGVVMVAVSTALAVLLVLGALREVFEPVVWTTAIALLATGAAAVHLFGPNPYDLALPASAGLALVLWIALVPTLRARRWIREHEDLYILHHASLETMRSLRHHVGEHRHERLVRVQQRASKRAWKLSLGAVAAICALSVTGTALVLSKLRRPDLDAARAEFEAAWQRGGPAAAAAFFLPNVREAQLQQLRGVLAGHGLTGDPPPLTDAALREVEDATWVDYRMGPISASTAWTIQDNRWILLRMDLPAPPLEPVLARFREAWSRSDAAGVAAFFSPESRAQMTANLEGAALGRGWSSWPTIRATDAGDPSRGELSVEFQLDDGPVATRWQLRPDGTWGLTVLKLPKR